MDLMTGRFFAPGRRWRFPPGALQVAVSRMDEAGTDPVEDPSSYPRLAELKVSELREILAAEDADLSRTVAVWPLVPDAYGYVANRPDTRPADFDLSRSWDGIGDFVSAIRAGGARRDMLRAAAQVRYLLYVGHRVVAEVADALLRHGRILDEAESRLARRRSFDSELDTIVEEARADLKLRLAEDPLPTVPAEQGIQSHARLLEWITPVLERWQRASDARLETLAARENEQLAALAGSPLEQAVATLSTKAARPALPGAADGTRVREAITAIVPHLERGIRSVWELKLGMSLDEARTRLSSLQDAASVGAAPGTYGWTGFATPEEALKTRRYVVAGDCLQRFAEAVPAVLEAGSAIADVLAEMRRDRAAQERQREAARMAQDAMDELVERYLDGDPDHGVQGWVGGAERLRERVHHALVVGDDNIRGLREQGDRLADARGRLLELLAAAPPPARPEDEQDLGLRTDSERGPA